MKKMILGVLLSTMMVGAVGSPAFAATTTSAKQIPVGHTMQAVIQENGAKIETVKLSDIKIGKYTMEEFQKLSKTEQDKILKELGIVMVKATEADYKKLNTNMDSIDMTGYEVTVNNDSIKINTAKNLKIGKYTFEEFQKLSKSEQDKVLKETNIKVVNVNTINK